jgi:pimeloyl-ACP methyl ester carboxylesterase
VQTAFGVVRVYRHGPDGGVPLVLLHCFWATSALWVEHIRALTSEFTVYTVDLLGQPGASVQDKSMTTAKHCAHCIIIEVLDELSVDGVHLVGRTRTGLDRCAYRRQRA